MDTSDDRHVFRSHHAGQPGSISAIRVNYNLSANAFDAHPPDSNISGVRQYITKWKNPRRLGEKPPWDARTRDEAVMVFPQRPLMHTLSEFQTAKIPVDFRALSVPDHYKSTNYVPKSSKFQFDRKLLMPESERGTLLQKNLKPPLKQAQSEREKGWNITTELDPIRSSVFKTKQYESFREVNKVKELSLPQLSSKYKTPQQKSVEQMKKLADVKDQQRQKFLEQEAAKQLGSNTSQRVFKMSNIHEWLDTTCGGIAKPAATGGGKGGGGDTLATLNGGGGAEAASPDMGDGLVNTNDD
eukprot:PhF_6_TR14136/c0_g1_i2/m.22612